MDKQTKLLISEFEHSVEGKTQDDLILFFENKKYEKLKSFHSEEDLSILLEYTKTIFSLDILKVEKKVSKENPETYISLLITDQSLSYVGDVIRFPYYKFDNMDKKINDVLEETKLSNDSIVQFNSVIDNKHNKDHSVEFLFYVYVDDVKNLNSILEIKTSLIREEDKLIYSKFLDSVIMLSFDEDLIKKIKKIKGILS